MALAGYLGQQIRMPPANNIYQNNELVLNIQSYMAKT